MKNVLQKMLKFEAVYSKREIPLRTNLDFSAFFVSFLF